MHGRLVKKDRKIRIRTEPVFSDKWSSISPSKYLSFSPVNKNGYVYEHLYKNKMEGNSIDYKYAFRNYYCRTRFLIFYSCTKSVLKHQNIRTVELLLHSIDFSGFK